MEITLTLNQQEPPALPSFISTHSLTRPKRQPRWIRARDAVAYLAQQGISTSVQTLFNMERRGELTTNRPSVHKTWFDLNEITDLFTPGI